MSFPKNLTKNDTSRRGLYICVYVLIYPSTLHIYIRVLDCVCLECKKNRKYFTPRKVFGLAGKLNQTEKLFLLTVKYQGLKCKIVYTSISPSKHLHLFSASNQREREKEK